MWCSASQGTWGSSGNNGIKRYTSFWCSKIKIHAYFLFRISVFCEFCDDPSLQYQLCLLGVVSEIHQCCAAVDKAFLLPRYEHSSAVWICQILKGFAFVDGYVDGLWSWAAVNNAAVKLFACWWIYMPIAVGTIPRNGIYEPKSVYTFTVYVDSAKQLS